MRSATRRILLLSTIFTVMALSLAFAAPSGAVLPDAAARYQQNMNTDWADEDAWDFDLDSSSIRYLASAGLTDVILPVNSIAYLPLDRDVPGRKPIEANYTQDGYQDDTIIVELTDVRAYNSTFHIAYVKIATPTQLRTAIAGKFGSSRTYKPTVFSKSMNAIVLLNGDYYTKTKAGFIVRQGETYRQTTSKNMDLLLIDENADFHIILRGHDNQKDAVSAYLQEHEIINGFFFGPALVVDGEQQEIPENYQFNPFGSEPRAAIGQLAPLTYVLVTVDGRIADNDGVTLPELASFMKEQLDCQQAYALDGGNSSALVFHNQLVSVKDVNERDVSDVIYFATAIDN